MKAGLSNLEDLDVLLSAGFLGCGQVESLPGNRALVPGLPVGLVLRSGKQQHGQLAVEQLVVNLKTKARQWNSPPQNTRSYIVNIPTYFIYVYAVKTSVSLSLSLSLDLARL